MTQIWNIIKFTAKGIFLFLFLFLIFIGFIFKHAGYILKTKKLKAINMANIKSLGMGIVFCLLFPALFCFWSIPPTSQCPFRKK